MITSSSIQYITRMLGEPALLTDMDRESVAAIIKEFPYFVPARYMVAAIAQKKTAYGIEAMADMWLYRGNWLQYNDFLLAAAKDDAVAKPREKIRFSLAKAEVEPEIVVSNIALTEVLPVIPEEADPNLHAQPILTEQHTEAEVLKAETIPEPEETVAEQISHHEAEIYADEMEDVPKATLPETIQPLIVKDALLQAGQKKNLPDDLQQKPIEKVQHDAPAEHEENKQEPAYEHHTPQSLYIDDDEVNGQDDLIIRPVNYTVAQYDFNKEQITNQDGNTLILPVYTDNYFFHQGIKVSDEIPVELDQANKAQPEAETEVTNDKDKSLMVMMSFSEWLLHFKTKTQKEIEEVEDKRALKSMWQQEKLAAANEEENEEIPEDVFNMAVNSITKEEDLASEALAQIHRKQGKYDKAIEMYRKLSLRNPQKIAYFAHKIEELLKEKEL
jgi:tetratricopeptide (TPR) repeat protein